MRQIRYSMAINEALDHCLTHDPRVILMGLGVPDPKGIFGTCLGLAEKFGPNRVFDMPCAENGMTGVLIGAALAGLRPVMVHQRIDFALLAMEQLVNQAAKWRYMFGGHSSVPIVVRMIVGRGWGQGPQHSQSLHSMFAHIPGLKVVMPASPADAKGLLIAAINDDSPVIFIEHRWLHDTCDHVPAEPYEVPIGAARIAKVGTDLTIASASYGVVDSLRAAQSLAEDGWNAEVVDFRSALPFDSSTLISSVEKTRRLLVVDTSWRTCGLSAEAIATVAETGLQLQAPPKRLTPASCPNPTSHALTGDFYVHAWDIDHAAREMLGSAPPPTDRWLLGRSKRLDVPDPSFKGPF